ncbi:MAG TPA: hypothetical protein VK846_09535 [Candidatus Limnocylindria bacterium]|nr:hypothetical protein [Candidatus Limnocylindria bacterium]
MRTQTVLASIITCAVLALGSVAQAADKKADVTGTWSWTQQPRGNNANATPRKSTLKLKAEGEKVTGTLSQPGRGADAAPRETEISDGKIKGDDISFSVKREFNGNAFVTKYAGKVEGDAIKGKMEVPGRDGGEPRSIDWEAKRDTAEKK